MKTVRSNAVMYDCKQNALVHGGVAAAVPFDFSSGYKKVMRGYVSYCRIDSPFGGVQTEQIPRSSDRSDP